MAWNNESVFRETTLTYQVEIVDHRNLRVASFDEVPLLRATVSGPDGTHRIQGILPAEIPHLGLGYRIRLFLDGRLFLEAPVEEVLPQWGDTRKLILDRFVRFHHVVEFGAQSVGNTVNRTVKGGFENETMETIVRESIDRTLGPVHYWINHTAYPEGAQREYSKFLGRKTAGNELEVGGISTGQWVDSTRIDLTGAFAKDGDTIAGLVVDGVAWPDLRMMMIDTEETSINSHTVKIHPEVADWSAAQYAASGYKVKADAATDFLQGLIDANGIDFIELNPHRGADGGFDDRVDLFGRYLGLVYGGGECYNAGLVEQGLAEVLLFADGKFHLPEMTLKDFYSYQGVHTDSVEAITTTVARLDLNGGLFENLTLLAYLAGDAVWSLDGESGITFRRIARPDRVVFFGETEHALRWGADSSGIANDLSIDGNAAAGGFGKSYTNTDSIDAYGDRSRSLDVTALTEVSDGDALAAGLLADVAYPDRVGEISFLYGELNLSVGDVVEVRGEELRRLDLEVPGEWNDVFTGRFVGRVSKITQEIRGTRIQTTVGLMPPLRSVDNPIAFILKGQPEDTLAYQFRLDDAVVGLDLSYHVG